VVMGLATGGPAEAADLRAGDAILAVGGTRVKEPRLRPLAQCSRGATRKRSRSAEATVTARVLPSRRSGVVVMGLATGGPAEAADLRAGDAILAVGGTRVKDLGAAVAPPGSGRGPPRRRSPRGSCRPGAASAARRRLYATEMEDGVVVMGLATGGPAEAADLRAGDAILAVGGTRRLGRAPRRCGSTGRGPSPGCPPPPGSRRRRAGRRTWWCRSTS
jgi:S1-C subfamily serine protease